MADTGPHLEFRSDAPAPYVGELFVADPPEGVTAIEWRFRGAPITDEITHVDVACNTLRFKRLNRTQAGSYEAVVSHGDGETPLDYTLSFRTEAVLVVHGIGEQVALDFAATYTDALTRPWDEVNEDIFEVPDTQIKTRRFRITWRPAHVRPTADGGALYSTDVYEHYWQPFVRDSQLRHFAGFLRNRLFAGAPLPRRLHDVVVQLVVLLSIVTVALFASGMDWPQRLAVVAGYAVAAWLVATLRAERHWLALALTASVGAGAGIVLGWVTTRATSGLFARPDVLAAALIAATGLAAGLASEPLWRTQGRPGLRLWVDGDEPPWASWFVPHVAVAVLAVLMVAIADGLGPRLEEFLWVFDDGVEAADRVVSAVPLVTAVLLGLLLAGASRKAVMAGLTVTLGSVLFVAFGQLAGGATGGRVWDNPIVQGAIALVGAAALAWLVLHFGDVLRYVDPSPHNHALRNQLADSGVDLLRRLHHEPVPGEAPADRIVVIGHSMGTQVAYDVLLRYWQQVNQELAGSLEKSPEDAARRGLEHRIRELYTAALDQPEQIRPVRLGAGGAAGLPSADPFPARAAYREAQAACQATLNDRWWGGERPADGRWLVTDFVTLASPLTHGPYLYPDLAVDIVRRRFAANPPVFQPAESFIRYFLGDADVFHQAAPFAVTRWTNLYYGNDVVGGPLAGVFGPGIYDVHVEDVPGLASVFPANHTHYPSDPRVRRALRTVLHPMLAEDDQPASHLLAAGRAKARAILESYLPAGATASWWTGARLERVGRTDRFLSGYRDGDQAALLGDAPADASLDARTELVPQPIADDFS